MKQQFAIGAKKPGAVAAVVRLPGVGRNQSVGSCLCTDQSVDQKFVSSRPRCREQRQVVRDLDLDLDLTLALPDFGHVIFTQLNNTQHTTYQYTTSSLTHGHPGTRRTTGVIISMPTSLRHSQ